MDPSVAITGTSPNGQAPRTLTIGRQADGRLSLWIHSPGSPDNGWQISVAAVEAIQAMVAVALDEPAGRDSSTDVGAR